MNKSKIISVTAHPNAKHTKVELDLLGNIHVYTSKPAIEGKANQAIIEALADHFNVKKNTIFLKSGGTTKQKIFEISSLTEQIM